MPSRNVKESGKDNLDPHPELDYYQSLCLTTSRKSPLAGTKSSI